MQVSLTKYLFLRGIGLDECKRQCFVGKCRAFDYYDTGDCMLDASDGAVFTPSIAPTAALNSPRTVAPSTSTSASCDSCASAYQQLCTSNIPGLSMTNYAVWLTSAAESAKTSLCNCLQQATLCLRRFTECTSQVEPPCGNGFVRTAPHGMEFGALAMQVRAYEAYWTQAQCLIYTGQLATRPDYYELQYVAPYDLYQLSIAQTSYVVVETTASLLTRMQHTSSTPFSAEGLQLGRAIETDAPLDPSVNAESCSSERPCLCRQGGWCTETVTKLMYLSRHRPSCQDPLLCACCVALSCFCGCRRHRR